MAAWLGKRTTTSARPLTFLWTRDRVGGLDFDRRRPRHRHPQRRHPKHPVERDGDHYGPVQRHNHRLERHGHGLGVVSRDWTATGGANLLPGSGGSVTLGTGSYAITDDFSSSRLNVTGHALTQGAIYVGVVRRGALQAVGQIADGITRPMISRNEKTHRSGLAGRLLSWAFLLAGSGPALSAEMPAGIERLLPPGFTILARADAAFGRHAFTIVALGKLGEDPLPRTVQSAPARPMLIFERQPDGSFRLAGENDSVVMRADGGGQCDPFLDSNRRIVVKARLFSVENGVACGPQHWTDIITFRFDDRRAGYVFDNERTESWSLNPSRDPSAEALVRDGPTRIERGDRARPVPFDRWRPSR